MTTYKVCFCFHRRYKPASSDPPEPIKGFYSKYSVNGFMGAEELQRFITEVQREARASREDVQAIIDSQREFRHLNLFRKGLSLDGFFRFLFAEENSPISHSLGVHQDMTAPLSHYFIYTSHNSYLTGNQLSSASSDVPIIKALKRGVKVIELDMWPNEKRDNVDIYHGRTLTTPVELLRCLMSIKEHAFTASPYPVIITLEDHLTPDLQAKVAKMLTETFGEMLFTPETEFLEEFPSPESLKMRILISTKPPKEYLDSKTGKDKDHETQKGPDDESSWGAEVSDSKLDLHTYSKTESEHTVEDEDPDEGERKPEYKRLIGIAARKKKGSMTESLAVDHKVTRMSLSEQTFDKATENHGTELVRYTQRNLLRIYPKGTRVTSSNYNPLRGWIHGAQMVALNMQGHGRSLWLMQGLFRANGGCGYVKKPDILLRKDPYEFDPKADLPLKETLVVWVYMGDGWRFDFDQSHFDKYSPPDFYTRVGIAGVPADTIMKKTRIIEDNWTPVWNEKFEFPLTVPELALLRIEVHEYDMSEKDDFGGQTCLPVWEIRPGIRTVPLCDRKGEPYKSVKLLMRFEIILYQS
ncbi:LOW QUALITY PROTEIN: phosphoinositide phospholipase C 2-like [Dioscorea cayenensis subsp. rotundata]|uniref:Phosphoinositide phospholipase C n=1 Tax=Dioscorea cayennensis subsp. rotundata TaxID=55577 RepID=A0AB40BPG0_DIOCR|nr:LOW QUALITY PROTEIN: phosphoinositide phospholipase C 2-like [Dioscorea cayenensis subsp. rotundata]